MAETQKIPDEMNRRIRKKLYDGEEVPTEEALIADENATKEKEKTLKAIQNLAASLVVKRDIAVRARAACGIEQIWREDELAFEGFDKASLQNRMIDYASGNAPPKSSNKGPKRSTVVINIVRPKCETAEGRFSDIVLPTDGKNWGLKTTPVPELASGIKDDRPAVMKETGQPVVGPNGQPATIKDIARSDKDVADEKMSKMEQVIEDQLTECAYNGECRKAQRNAVRLGTGILKGPMVIKNLKKSWTKKEDGAATVRVLTVEESETPASRSVDPWDCYPDPECRDDIKRAGYIWERRAITPRELRSFIGVDGYLTDQINAVLLEAPQKVTVAMAKDDMLMLSVRYDIAERGSAYEMWEYNGDVNREELEAMGVDVASAQDIPSLTACVVMINDKPIKATLNPLDTGDLNYDFFVWTPRAGVPWGLGVARELASVSRVLIAAWRAMMDNAGDSAGSNTVVGADVEPVDGEWAITGKKLWRSTNDTLRIDQQFHQFQIDNNQKELQAIIELCLKFADMESQIPMLFNGEKGELPETLGATNIMVDSANVALRSRVKLWDDAVTRPHITRYYDWNMQYHEDDGIKGDYKVDPRGISFLLERDQQKQDAKGVLQLRADAELSGMIDWKRVIKKLNLDMLPDDKIAENEDARKNQPQVSDPALEAAKIRSQADLEKAKLTQQADMQELEFKAVQADLDRQHEQQLKLMDRDIKAMELSQTSGIELNKIKAQLTQTAQKLNTQIQLSHAEKAAQDGKSVPEVSGPPTEPAQKAPTGRSYQE
jgi:hypothetical protein